MRGAATNSGDLYAKSSALNAQVAAQTQATGPRESYGGPENCRDQTIGSQFRDALISLEQEVEMIRGQAQAIERRLLGSQNLGGIKGHTPEAPPQTVQPVLPLFQASLLGVNMLREISMQTRHILERIQSEVEA